jgi:hypothetical protein
MATNGSTDTQIISGINGSGTYLPMSFYTNNALGMQLDTSGNLSVTGTGSVSGNLSFNSGYGSSAVAYGCRAWVNFNGTGTVAIRASGNVSSITDGGTGVYTVNFTTAMPNANYAVTFGTGNNDSGSYGNTQNISAMSTSSFGFLTTIQSGGVLNPTDLTFQTVAVFR